MAYFPMFVDLTDQSCLIVGGGHVALRKVQVLLDFDARVTVVASEICQEIREIADAVGGERVSLQERAFVQEDLQGQVMVVAATDDKQVNHEIAQASIKLGIPVNAVDQKEDCSFIFSSYVKEANLVAAFSSAGNSPLLTQYLKKEEKEILKPWMGELNEQLGQWRTYVQAHYETEKERKAAYRRIADAAFAKERVLNEDEILKALASE